MLACDPLNYFQYISWLFILSVSGADPMQNTPTGVPKTKTQTIHAAFLGVNLNKENAMLYQDDGQQYSTFKS
jgi:hypothetical protein